jgi:hypothetical protein
MIIYEGGIKMFCPKCKYEYREGFNFCTDCEIKLVDELPSEEFEYIELITIAVTSDLCIIPIVKSILDYAEIKYFIKGEKIRNITVFNNNIEIQVTLEDAQNAKDLLKDLDLN